MESVRIGNIEFRETSSDLYLGEIVCWYPNGYYGKEKEYQWSENGEFAFKEDPRCRVHKSCFKNKETCYVIAFVDDCYDEEPDITSVGSRFLHLEEKDFADYLKVCKHVFKQFEDVGSEK